MTMYYSEARALMDSARDPGKGKPLQNNTRLYEREIREPYQRGDGGRTVTVFEVVLHATAVVTIYPNFWELRSGGWHTVTTQDRINSYAPGFVGSNYRGDGWMLPIQNAAPEPSRGSRTAPHPFPAHDPGPEPVKTPDGCQFNVRHVKAEFKRVLTDHDELRPNDRLEIPDAPNRARSVTAYLGEYMGRGRRYDHYAYVWRTVYTYTVYGEARYKDHYWGNDANLRRHDMPDAARVHWNYEQCPHCAAFSARHERWHVAMYGERWGRRSGHGWERYCEMMETYGSREAWLDAAREDLRQVKADNAAWREWYYSNHVPFFDGVRVDHNGLVTRKQAEAYFKAARRQERENKRREREHEARQRRQRYLERRRNALMQRREARTPQFERLAAQIASDIRDARSVLTTTNESQEVTQDVG